MKNLIAFQKGFICVPNQNIDNRVYAVHVQAELMRFGYILTEDAFFQLAYADKANIVEFHDEVINWLRYITGDDKNYKPFYPGFPEQVMEKSELELWMNQIVYYHMGCGFVLNNWDKEKKVAFEHIKYKEITSGTEEDFSKIFFTLASSGQSLTKQDSEVISWFVNNYVNLKFPEKISFKENLCLIIGELIKQKKNLSQVSLPKLTTTDILRVIVSLSGGDISLPAVPKPFIGRRKVKNPDRDNFKFKKFSRSERKYILSLLEETNCDVREMKLKINRWIRIGEILHPAEYPQFPKVYNAFKLLRNEKVTSWYGELEKLYKENFLKYLNKLSERPGEFIRKLDWLLRNHGSSYQLIFNKFFDVCEKVSNKVLFEVYTHFEGRKTPKIGRSIFIKGARKKTKLPDLPAIDSKFISLIQEIVIATIKKKITSLPSMGDCWIDPELKKIPLPTNMRSLSESLVPVIRGQRIPILGTKKFIRPFIHWYDEIGNMDLDLHGFLIGFDVRQFGYNGTHSDNYGCYSGDVRHRKGACAEYVDINIERTIKAGYKYFIPVIHNFMNYPLSQIKDCVTGCMERDDASANETWLPSTLNNSFRLQSSKSSMVLIGVYDLVTREYIHLDLEFETVSRYVNNNDSEALMNVILPFIKDPEISIYDLLSWHVESRGRLVQKENAETTFLYDDFCYSYTKIIQYMGI